MKNSKSDLIAYAMSFVSFVFPKVDETREIILFGSVARGEAGKESDIDLFFDVEYNEEEIKKELDNELIKFSKSKIAEAWFLRGIKNEISIKVGKLDEWKLKKSIISDGITLYSRHKENIKDLSWFIHFNLDPIKDIAKRNKIIRKLFGRKEKNNLSEGIIEKKGKRISPSSFVIKKEHANDVIELLNKEKVSYKFFEIWTDPIT